MVIPMELAIVLTIMGAFTILHSVLLMGVLRMLAQVYEAVFPDKAPAADITGEVAPEFSAMTLSGSEVSSSAFIGRLTALLFVTPSCASCVTTLEELESVRARAAGNVIVICGGEVQECSELHSRMDPVQIVHDQGSRIRLLFGVTQTPYAVLIGKSGRIQSTGEPSRGYVDSVTQPS